MALKYNPLLRLNLQESEDAEQILGDGYNEKLLTWQDFLNDINNNIKDNYEERKYLIRTIAQLDGKNINFSCILNFYTTATFNPSNIFFNGLITKILSFNNYQRINFWGINFSSKFILIENINVNGNTITLNSDCQIIIHNCTFSSINDFTINCNNHHIVINLFNCTKTNNININITNCSNTTFFCDGSIKIVGNTKNYINLDSALDINSPGLLPNSVITAALQQLQPDSTLDANSTKAIQNQAVMAAINNINQSIGSITNKVSKFHSASDSLIENEIAQYQGEDDSDNGLTRGYFYEQGQAWQKVPAGTTQTVTVNQYWEVTDINNNVTDYYDLGYNYLNNFFKILHTTDNTIYIYMFTGLLNNDLNTYQADGKTYYVYPFAKVNNTFDFDNALEVIENNFYYNGNLLSIAESAEGGFILGEKLLNLAKDTLYLSAFQSNAPFMFEFDSSENLLLTSPLRNAYIKNQTTVSITAESVTYTDYTIQAGAAGFVPVSVQDLTPINNFIKTTVTNTDTFSDSSGSFTATATIYKNSFMCFVKLELTTTASSTQPITDIILNIGFNILENAYISCINPNSNNTFPLTLSKNGNISFRFGAPDIPIATQLTFSALLA